MTTTSTIAAQKNTKPTAAERKAEIRTLQSLMHSNQLRFDCWSHLRACIELQVKALLDPKMDLARFDLDEDKGWTPETQDILERALDIRDWLGGDGLPAPSQEWRRMFGELTAAVSA